MVLVFDSIDFRYASNSRLHLDFAGPFENRMFLVIFDAHSKWIESFPTKNATSTVVIDCLGQCLPDLEYLTLS